MQSVIDYFDNPTDDNLLACSKEIARYCMGFRDVPREMREEIAQEVTTQVWQKATSEDTIDNPVGWEKKATNSEKHLALRKAVTLQDYDRAAYKSDLWMESTPVEEVFGSLSPTDQQTVEALRRHPRSLKRQAKVCAVKPAEFERRKLDLQDHMIELGLAV